MSNDHEGVGFFGKVPVRGDFVSRGLPSAFIDCWDRWLQGAISCSREQLGQRWLDYYLASPIWHFVLSAGICGQRPWIGLLMPSVDRVGRYFPLTLASTLSPALQPRAALSRANNWFAVAEQLALSCLRDDFDLNRFEDKVKSHAFSSALVEVSNVEAEKVIELSLGEDLQTSMRFLEFLLERRPDFLIAGAGDTGRYTLWCTRGSEQVAASVLMCQTLPPVEGFAAFLDGQWKRWGWREQRMTLITEHAGSSDATTS